MIRDLHKKQIEKSDKEVISIPYFSLDKNEIHALELGVFTIITSFILYNLGYIVLSVLFSLIHILFMIGYGRFTTYTITIEIEPHYFLTGFYIGLTIITVI